MGRAIRLLATTGIVAVAFATGCNGDLPTDPTVPAPTPVPIPTPQPTPAPDQIAATFAAKVDGVFKNVITSWRGQAGMANVVINASEGAANPGCVTGPTLSSFFTDEFAKVPGSADERRMMTAFAAATTSGFYKWQRSFSAKLTFPGFDSVQAPQAPPTANWPQALSTGTADESGLSSEALAAPVRAAFPSPTETQTLAINAAATKLADRFQNFKATTTLRNVIGSGPVPSYNPPFTPAGPVVNGRGTGDAGQVFK